MAECTVPHRSVIGRPVAQCVVQNGPPHLVRSISGKTVRRRSTTLPATPPSTACYELHVSGVVRTPVHADGELWHGWSMHGTAKLSACTEHCKTTTHSTRPRGCLESLRSCVKKFARVYNVADPDREAQHSCKRWGDSNHVFTSNVKPEP